MTTDRGADDDREAPRRGDRLSGGDLAAFAGQLAGLTTAGLPLPSGLRALGDELPPGALRRTFHDVARRLEAGDSPEEAVGAQGRRVPQHLRGVLLAGLRSGRPGEVLGRYVEASRAGMEIRRKLWLGLAYPLMLLAAAGALLAFAYGVVIPEFGKIFADFGLPLPAATRLVLETSAAVAGLDWRAPAAVAGVLVLLALTWRSWLGRVPLLGTLGRWSALAEFSRLLGLLVEGELPMPAALDLAAAAARDPRLAAAARMAAREVEAGHDLASALGVRPAFPAGYARLVGWGEGNRALPEALEVLGAMYEARARAFAGYLGTVAGVVVMILVLWGIGVIVGALFLPLINLIRALSGP